MVRLCIIVLDGHLPERWHFSHSAAHNICQLKMLKSWSGCEAATYTTAHNSFQHDARHQHCFHYHHHHHHQWFQFSNSSETNYKHWHMTGCSFNASTKLICNKFPTRASTPFVGVNLLTSSQLRNINSSKRINHSRRGNSNGHNVRKVKMFNWSCSMHSIKPRNKIGLKGDRENVLQTAWKPEISKTGKSGL